MKQRLLPPVQILVHAAVGFALSFLKLITLIIGIKDVILYTFHYFSRVYVRGWLVHVCLLGSCAVHVTGLSAVVTISIKINSYCYFTTVRTMTIIMSSSGGGSTNSSSSGSSTSKAPDHTMKAHGRVEVQLHSFVNSARLLSPSPLNP